MSVEYLDLADFIAISAAVTGLDEDTITKIADLGLADSALHAPSASFGDREFYEDFVDKAAVLVVRLARNHPLPDGNKRAAWVSMRMFIDMNGWSWSRRPAIDEGEETVLAIAAGELDEKQTATWLRGYLVEPESE